MQRENSAPQKGELLPEQAGFPFHIWSAFIVAVAALLVFGFSADNVLPMPAALAEWKHGGYMLSVEESGIKANIFVHTIGDPTAKHAILFLHDAFLTSFVFKDVAQMLASAGVFAVLFDFPGFGFSDASVVDAENGDLWIAAVVASLELNKVHIVAQGTALGAACRYAAQNPTAALSVMSFGATLGERIARYGEPEPSWLSSILQNAVHFLALTHECDGITPDASAANAYFSSLHPPSVLHGLRASLLFPEYAHSCNASVPQLWIKQGPTTLVSSRAQLPSDSVCLHLVRKNDFVIVVLSFIAPTVSFAAPF
jgi:pimeloyl-ACP methyl ester carboxylesterase